MLVMLFWGCKEPGLMDAVTAALGDEVRVAAEPGLRLSLDIAGVIAETCRVEVLNGYQWSGMVASTIGVGAPDSFTEQQSGAVELVFNEVGVGGSMGVLTLAAESARASWSVDWESTSGELRLEGTVAVERCDAEAIRLSGGLSWSDPVHVVTVSLGENDGVVAFDIDGSGIPISGQASWNGGDTELEATLTLDPADLGLALGAEGRWTGFIEGKGWEHATAIAFP